MKRHELYRLAATALAAVILTVALTRPAPPPSPTPQPHRRPLVKRVLRWLALWVITSSEPAAPVARQTPNPVANQEPDSADRIDHHHGW